MKSAYRIAAVCLCVLIAAPAVAQTSSPSKSPAAAATAAPQATTAPQPAAGSQAQGGLVDINSASAAELDKLPGIGPARAKAIISHRPYSGKDDLAQRKVIPQNVYDQIKDKIIARQGSRTSSDSAGPASAAKSK